jgi:hypothetical protein
LNNIKVWLHGLAATLIGGAAAAGTAVFAEPKDFNFTHAGLIAFGKVILVGAAIPAFAYLKQSPVPK